MYKLYETHIIMMNKGDLSYEKWLPITSILKFLKAKSSIRKL